MRKKLVLLAVLVGLIYLLFGPSLFLMLMVPILWFAGRGIVARSKAAREPFLKTAARLFVAIFASLGCLIAIQVALRDFHFGPSVLLVGNSSLLWPLAQAIPASFIALSGLFVYWLDDACALVPPGAGRTTMKALVSLILTSFAAIVFVVALSLAHFLLADRNYPDYPAWVYWVLLFLGVAGTFYVNWKLLLPARNAQGHV
jgi:hypothetical protein